MFATKKIEPSPRVLHTPDAPFGIVAQCLLREPLLEAHFNARSVHAYLYERSDTPEIPNPAYFAIFKPFSFQDSKPPSISMTE